VDTAKSPEEGAAAVVSVQTDSVLPGNEGKLIHLSGEVRTSEPVQDSLFKLNAEALRLARVVEMDQWKERKTSETRKKLGGGEETVTRYSYEKAKSDKQLDSSDFKEVAGHANLPGMPLPAGTTVSEKATLGAFRIPSRIIHHMDGEEPLMPTAECLVNLSPDLKGRIKKKTPAARLGFSFVDV